MKRNIILLLIMVISIVAYGQKKPKVNRALKALQDGELMEAKEIIDAAIEHRKTKDDAKTWYYRALIYAALDTTSNQNYQNLDQDPLRVSVEAFDKATALNDGKSELYITGPNGFPELKSQQIQKVWGHYLNQGVIAFQNQNSEEAVRNFERCQIVLPKDTTCYFYAGLAAQNAQDYDKAADNFYKLINNLDHHDPDVYNSLIYIESSIRKNDDKALELIRRAKERWPNNLDLAKTEINTLIRLERLDEARTELEAAIKNEPDNPELYFSLGVMHDEVGNKEKAIEAYKNALEIDPDHVNANFNLAVLYFNDAVQTFKERNSLGISGSDIKKGKELEKRGNEELKKALPYWEKVRENDPSNRVALEQLRYIYVQLRQNDKAQEVQKAMDQYGYSNEE